MKKGTTELRSRIMRAVKSHNTTPELKVRSLVHKLGYRFRLHRKDLPGSPDLAFPGKKKAIFVHGCFWHGHRCARGARVPKSNTEYWRAKIARNVQRDKRTQKEMAKLGWQMLAIWECQLKNSDDLGFVLDRFLSK